MKTTKNVVRFLVLSLCIGGMVGGRQLPPEVQLDRLLVRAETLNAADDLDGALAVMSQALALQEEYGLEFRPKFHFVHAQMALEAGRIETAERSVTEYLKSVGREGEFYWEALTLLEELDGLRTRVGPDCHEAAASACWMALIGRPDCFIWIPKSVIPERLLFGTDERLEWTGGCSEGRATGAGRLKRAGDRVSHAGHEGTFRLGKRHGKWVHRGLLGKTLEEGSYVDGERHGRWVHKLSNGSTQEGSYVNGTRDGHWVEKDADGVIREGSYVDGQRDGQWVEEGADGRTREGPYVDGKRHGVWVLKEEDGSTYENRFVDGRPGAWERQDVQEDFPAPGATNQGTTRDSPSATSAGRTRTSQGQPRVDSATTGACEIPGFPNNPDAFDPNNTRLSYCEVRVGGQWGPDHLIFYALDAELKRCQFTMGMVLPEKVGLFREQMAQACDLLEAMAGRGGSDCRCPRSYYNLGRD